MKRMMLLAAVLVVASACTSKDDLKKMIKENPEIITEAIEANPNKFIDALNNAVKAAQEGEGKRREEEEKKALEESFNKPLQAEIRSDESFRGNKDAPITLIEYSDFECPFCSRGYGTVMELMKKYEGKIRFVYKHLPLSFHPQAMPAAQYYEAIRLQSPEKAWEFHDAIYKNQRALQNGESFLKAEAKKLKVDMAKLEKDAKSEAVQKRIDADMAEAAKFGFQGTPGFLLNGVPVKGAYPTSHFDGLIEELKKRGKINI
ncbi:DsbA family protein [Peredibacter starrii]|uniref:Thioredoxin domain-containing protein n=1 Tax=Peredibacter starrii TaxID=28202 RepID=A0AAX4HN96_9BACT|nr:thioredoxin domain-containing protein [Peredibacter starrii]WPU64706.1 thioredoxin domain-containing protein [Peredibacter starrii]